MNGEKQKLLNSTIGTSVISEDYTFRTLQLLEQDNYFNSIN